MNCKWKVADKFRQKRPVSGLTWWREEERIKFQAGVWCSGGACAQHAPAPKNKNKKSAGGVCEVAVLSRNLKKMRFVQTSEVRTQMSAPTLWTGDLLTSALEDKLFCRQLARAEI